MTNSKPTTPLDSGSDMQVLTPIEARVTRLINESMRVYNLTAQEIAKQLGVSRQSMAKYLQHPGNINLDSLTKLEHWVKQKADEALQLRKIL